MTYLLGNCTSPIITAPLSAARYIQCDEKWLITRVPIESEIITWVPDLAPSQMLFRRYTEEWKGSSVDNYWALYVDLFQEELKSEEKLKALRRLWQLSSKGVTVALFCYCLKPATCHRTLVGGFLRSHGAEVREYVPQQASLFGK